MGIKLAQKVVFVLGKGGTGRSSLAGALGLAASRRGERTLIVQWSLCDAIAALFGTPAGGHQAHVCSKNLETMNYTFPEALREYFVSHLGMHAVFNNVVLNRHVWKLLEAAPGLPELFFLGRIFWLAELAAKERRRAYDRIIVDAPASGHGAALFSLPRSISAMGIPGPLASESARVDAFLNDATKVGVLLTALPEELPAQECLDLLERVRLSLKVGPQGVFINRSVPHSLWNPKIKADIVRGVRHFEAANCRTHVLSVGERLGMRRDTGIWLSEQLCERGVPSVTVPDLLCEDEGPPALVSALSDHLAREVLW